MGKHGEHRGRDRNGEHSGGHDEHGKWEHGSEGREYGGGVTPLQGCGLYLL